jgi:hypothetical protein
VHADGQADALSRSVSARAFAIGQDLFPAGCLRTRRSSRRGFSRTN